MFTDVNDVNMTILSQLSLFDAQQACQTNQYNNDFCKVFLQKRLRDAQQKAKKVISLIPSRDMNGIILQFNDTMTYFYFDQLLTQLGIDDEHFYKRYYEYNVRDIMFLYEDDKTYTFNFHVYILINNNYDERELSYSIPIKSAHAYLTHLYYNQLILQL